MSLMLKHYNDFYLDNQPLVCNKTSYVASCHSLLKSNPSSYEPDNVKKKREPGTVQAFGLQSLLSVKYIFSSQGMVVNFANINF